MSVLVHGMEMPRSCVDCPLTWVDDEYDKRCCITDKVVLGTIGRQDNANCTDCDCPLVEVPTPHSRLIDAHELYGAIIDKGQSNERGKYRIGDFWELNGREIR